MPECIAHALCEQRAHGFVPCFTLVELNTVRPEGTTGAAQLDPLTSNRIRNRSLIIEHWALGIDHFTLKNA